jgi:xanthine dehydrogenase accessory factor
MKGALDIFRFVLDATERGERTALVTITDVIGSSSRGPGTHLAVSETGAFRGSVSGGCVEAALVGLAQRTIARGASETIRLGAGSPYIDIRLPCGGGLDLLVIPNPSRDVLSRACAQLDQRQSVHLALHPDGRIWIEQSSDEFSGWSTGVFHVRHDPELRLVIIGHGSETEALTRLAVAYGAMVEVFTPDAAIAEASGQRGARVWHLNGSSSSVRLTGDDHTAIVMLLHDHDWEPELLIQALSVRAFYIGAMGSRRTHERRLTTLRQHGVPDALSRRIVGPIGLLPSARDPKTLALSILSQIVNAYRSPSGGKDLAHFETSSPRQIKRKDAIASCKVVQLT